jgi:hypothetical protein
MRRRRGSHAIAHAGGPSPHPIAQKTRAGDSGRSLATCLLALALVLTASAGRAVRAAQVDPLSFEHDTSKLKARIAERWRAIPLQNGLLLVPRRPSTLFKGVELTRDGTIAIDGRIVTGVNLQNRLGADADVVLRLSYLSPTERATLFQSQADNEPLERGVGASGKRASAANPATAAPAGATTARRAPGAQGGSSAPWTEVMPIARGDRFRIGGDATVDESEQVKRVTTVLGSTTIDGVVAHDVLAIGGDVRLGPRAIVRGSITIVGGVLQSDPGARLDGQVSELSFRSANLHVFGPHDDVFNVGITPDWPRIARITFIGGLLMSAIWLVLCAGALLVAPAAIHRTREHVARGPVGAFIAGLVMQVLFLPVMALVVSALAMSVIGIPLIALVPVAMFALFIATIFGSTAMLVAIGERLVGHTMPTLALLIGGSLLYGVTLAGRYLWIVNSGKLGWGFAFACVGLIIEYLVATIGLGGAILAWTRQIASRRRHAIATRPSADTGTPAEAFSSPIDF